MYTICIGDAKNGFSFEGLFTDQAQAEQYVEQYYQGLTKPVGVLRIEPLGRGNLKGQLTVRQ